ncbi:unnamed protein product [Rotaria sordida]|uniref:Uncharacterized protein n=1 Tax=Rotaria sordida TaxID=392033 RepID=A0A814W5P6_9BILA|nr:unnamed protein product [Rotaria sordida]
MLNNNIRIILFKKKIDFYDKDGKSNNNSNNYGLLRNSYKYNNRTSNGNKLLDDFYSFVHVNNQFYVQNKTSTKDYTSKSILSFVKIQFPFLY